MKSNAENDSELLINRQEDDSLFFSGSCFSDTFPSKLKKYKFNVWSQSHGIIFNPISLSRSILDIAEGKVYRKEDLNQNDDVFFSYQHHGDFSSLDPELSLKMINEKISEQHQAWGSAKRKVVILTLGTSFVYELKETGAIVANCHKMPGHLFTKRMLSVKEIMSGLEKVVKLLSPNDELILTVSPVRHYRDGLIENNQSKGALLLAIKYLQEQYPQIKYFHSYEMIIDELRDYRYFEKDGVHPNELAVEYVWNEFQNRLLLVKERERVRDFDSLFLSLNHRPKFPGSNASKKFFSSLQSQFEQLKAKYPSLNFDEEQQQLNDLRL